MSETSSVQPAKGRRVKAREVTVSRPGPGLDDAGWERARLIPVSGITGPDEQERRGSSALLAVLESVKEFGRALTVSLGAPAGVISTYIEVPFKLGEKHLRPDGLIRVVRGSKSWTALVEVKTGLTQNDKGAAEVVNRFGQLMSFAAMRLSRQLGVEVVPVLSAVEAKDPGHRLQSAVVTFAETGRLHGALRVPHAVAPIEITADVRAGQVRCAVTVAAPRAGRPSTRVNWLARQLREAPGDLCIEPIAAWQRSRAPAKNIAQIRDDPKVLVDDPKRELRAFTVSLAANIGTKRGQGHGSFVSSIVSAIDHFYAEAVQHIKPWTQTPPRVKDDEPPQDHQAASVNAITAEPQDIRAENGLQPELALAPSQISPNTR